MRQRRGFTLVELAIVLVIIGLLIGGILAAQSMISTARINAQVQQIGQFDAMVLNFKENYHYLPGDAPAFGGDGDGLLDASDPPNYHFVLVFECDIANFWHDLDPVQFPGNSACVQPGGRANLSGTNKNVPLSKLGSTNSYFIASALADSIGGYADAASHANYYAILNSTQAQSISPYNWYHFTATTNANSAVAPLPLLSLDKKMDDGLANTGNVISGSIANYGSSGYGGIVPTPATGICSNGAAYYTDSSHSGYECTPLIRIGGSVGVPQ